MLLRLITPLSFLVLWCGLLSAHDVRPIDQAAAVAEPRIAMDVDLDSDDPQKAQEALLKLHFALMAANTQSSSSKDASDRRFGPAMNLSLDMGKTEFETIVSKINAEVQMLRSQALVLSNAYHKLLEKHKRTVQELEELQSRPDPSYHQSPPAPVSYVPENPFFACPTIPAQTQSPATRTPPPTPPPPPHHTNNQDASPNSPPVCNCNCIYNPPSSGPGKNGYTESNVIGNKNYYYNVLPNGKKSPSALVPPPWVSAVPENQLPTPISYSGLPPALPSSSSSSSSSSSNKPHRPLVALYNPSEEDLMEDLLEDPDDPDPYNVNKVTSSHNHGHRPRPSYSSKRRGEDHVMEGVVADRSKPDRRKQQQQPSFFERHTIGLPEQKLYSEAEVQALFNQWLRESGMMAVKGKQGNRNKG